ncbi:MAG: nitroreductase [Spirochaetia bacterium]|nr:nitroreductase [Spirochaetia bacterium]
MITQDCINSRKSSRKFLKKDIPRETIREVIREAMRSPSYKNSQPWEVIVVSGNKKNELSEYLILLSEKNTEIEPDIPVPQSWPEYIQNRISDTMNKRSLAFGVTSGDPESVKKSKQANFNFYGAPAGLFFYQDASLGQWSLLDMGMFVENVILGFHSRGIASVPQAFLIDYSKQVKTFLNIPLNKKLVLGMSIGYPDTNDIRSNFTTPRVLVDEILKWIE